MKVRRFRARSITSVVVVLAARFSARFPSGALDVARLNRALSAGWIARSFRNETGERSRTEPSGAELSGAAKLFDDARNGATRLAAVARSAHVRGAPNSFRVEYDRSSRQLLLLRFPLLPDFRMSDRLIYHAL